MSEKELPPPPKPDSADLRHRIEKAIVGTNPVTGAIAELLDVLTPPLERRRARWFEQLWEAVAELQQRVKAITGDALRDNEAFVSAALHATHIALRNHQLEKLGALRNAVLNVAAGSAPEDDQQIMFLDAVDGLTVSHIAVLKKLVEQDKRSHQQRIHHHSDAVRPSRAPDDRFAQIIRDLWNRGFVETNVPFDQLHNGTVGGAHVKLTAYGTEFLDFITSPLEKSGVSA
jgi:hypothetical protein